MAESEEEHLKVFGSRSELVVPGATTQIFAEGPSSVDARRRYKSIQTELAHGYLEKQIELCQHAVGSLRIGELTQAERDLIDALIGSMTSEVGRALIGLTVLQMCIKAISPGQSIRLHKSSHGRSGFSWVEGLSMRSLDASYVTPALRQSRLLMVNSFGVMMTRSLAENYPYSAVYKASLRGAKDEWLQIVEALEVGTMSAEPALQALLSKLLNNAAKFLERVDALMVAVEDGIGSGRFATMKSALLMIEAHIDASDYAARLMEVAMHALAQAEYELSVLPGLSVAPLSQMRSANKKHGNVGDIEFLDGREIVEAWDAKYGKPYLRDELEELNDKLGGHPSLRLVGFVTSVDPIRLNELERRIEEIETLHLVTVEVKTLNDWVGVQLLKADAAGVPEAELAEAWVRAYAESLGQKRPELAPIDEPCFQWVESLIGVVG